MAVINLSAPLFYYDGISGVSAVVGYESLKNRVARYSFNAPSQGASGINFTFSGNSQGKGRQPTEFYFFVGTSPNSHENAGLGYEYSGILSSNGNYVYTGTLNMVLYPNKTYYLWVFPTTNQYGWVSWGAKIGNATAESFGAAFSTIDRQEGTIGEEMSIRVNRYDTNYRHTVTYEFGGESGTLCEYSPEENIRWTPPIDLLYQTPNSDKKSGRIIITTYDKYFVEIGSVESELSLSVPDWVVPSVSAIFLDKTNAKPTFGVFVQGVSVVDFIVESNGAYGSSIVKTQRYIGGVEYNDLPVSLSGNITASVVVTDSRGRISSYEETIFIQEYQFPQISISASRCNQDGAPNETGEYANVVMNLKSYQINGINEAFVEIQYGDNSVKVSVVVGERTVSEIVPAPSVSPIRISATLTDLLSSSEPATMILSIGYATLDFLAGGKGIAFGTTATQEGFTCAMDAWFTGGVFGVLPAMESSDHPGCYYRMVGNVREWLNPPFVVGIEYCTTQRWKGKPVFAKLLQFTGLFPNGAQTHYFSNQFPGVTEVVNVTATGTNGSTVVSLPFVDQANSFSCWAYNVSGGQIAIASNYKTAYTSVFALVKYIK
jgi:hypothetical protein